MKQENFKDVKFMTARQKYSVYKLFKRFVENGFLYKDFTHCIYEHLHLHCGFIAHYDITGFYNTYFPDVDDSFISRFLDGDSYNVFAIYGDYADINIAIAEILKTQVMLNV